MDNTLVHLIDSLESVLAILKEDAGSQVFAALHDNSELPKKELYTLASKAINLLHETEQMLEPSSLRLADHFFGYMSTKCLCAAVELEIPDLLRTGPKTIRELAFASSSHQDRLQQILRVLYNNGIFTYDAEKGYYSNNSTSELLLSDHWTQWRNWVDLYGNEFYDMSRGIPESCRKDAVRCAAQINFGTDKSMFTYFTDQGWLPRLHKTLGGGAVAQAPGILEDYPWDEISDQTILDIGGGSGGLVALLLRRHKNMEAAIIDLPKVIEQARANFHSLDGQHRDVGDRIPSRNLIVGDFFVEIPSFKVYSMKWCLHDWDDFKAQTILKNIRRAIVKGPESRLIVLESILEDGRTGRLSRYADLNMMVTVGGQERTEVQWRSLAKQTGWEIKRIFRLRNAWPCALEFVPVSTSVDDDICGNDTKPAEISYSDRESQLLGRVLSLEVSSEMRFLEPWDSARGNPFIRSAPAEGFDYMNFKWVDCPVSIIDARGKKSQFELDTHGFAFYDDHEGGDPKLLEALRQNSPTTVKNLYYPRVERFVKNVTGASRVIIFDHTHRKRRPEMETCENPTGKEQPATMVHCDQSTKGALRRLAQNMSPDQDIDTILKGRVKLINVWRPLNGPVQDWPLALMDYRSLNQDNTHLCDLLRDKWEERGQTVNFSHAPTQKWYYLQAHRPDEVTVIKIWDNNPGTSAKLCAHSAFKHPHTPPDAAPRESIEIRCFAFF